MSVADLSDRGFECRLRVFHNLHIPARISRDSQIAVRHRDALFSFDTTARDSRFENDSRSGDHLCAVRGNTPSVSVQVGGQSGTGGTRIGALDLNLVFCISAGKVRDRRCVTSSYVNLSHSWIETFRRSEAQTCVRECDATGEWTMAVRARYITNSAGGQEKGT